MSEMERLYQLEDRLRCKYNGRYFSGKMEVVLPTAIMLEAAEAIAALRAENERLKVDVDYWNEAQCYAENEYLKAIARAEKAEATAERYREALEFYAQEENWFIRFGCGEDFTSTGTSACDADSGTIARNALKGES